MKKHQNSKMLFFFQKVLIIVASNAFINVYLIPFKTITSLTVRKIGKRNVY